MDVFVFRVFGDVVGDVHDVADVPEVFDQEITTEAGTNFRPELLPENVGDMSLTTASIQCDQGMHMRLRQTVVIGRIGFRRRDASDKSRLDSWMVQQSFGAGDDGLSVNLEGIGARIVGGAGDVVPSQMTRKGLENLALKPAALPECAKRDAERTPVRQTAQSTGRPEIADAHGATVKAMSLHHQTGFAEDRRRASLQCHHLVELIAIPERAIKSIVVDVIGGCHAR